MPRPRDNQRSRVYRAEWAHHPGGQTIATADLQTWVDAALDRRPIRARWGIVAVQVELGRGGGRSRGGVISLGVYARNPITICHELAHELTPTKYAAHGPEFVGVMLFVVETVLGADEAQRLRAAYKATGAKTSRAAIPTVRATVPAARAQRRRAIRKAAREEAVREIQVALQRGYLTKADLRRLSA